MVTRRLELLRLAALRFEFRVSTIPPRDHEKSVNVDTAGLEPALLAKLGFKASMSANSITYPCGARARHRTGMRCYPRWFLKPVCLPIPSLGQVVSVAEDFDVTLNATTPRPDEAVVGSGRSFLRCDSSRTHHGPCRKRRQVIFHDAVKPTQSCRSYTASNSSPSARRISGGNDASAVNSYGMVAKM